MEFHITSNDILVITIVFFAVKWAWRALNELIQLRGRLDGLDLSNMSTKEIEALLDDDELERVEEQIRKLHIKMFLEKEGDMLLAYRDDGAFIAQGKTVEEVATHFHERFPEATGYLIDKSAEEGYLIRGE